MRLTQGICWHGNCEGRGSDLAHTKKTPSRNFIALQACKASIQAKMKLLGLILSSFLITQISVKSSQAVNPCDPAKCKLPDCRCASTEIPGGLSPEQTPQILTISYDDALRVQDYVSYYSKVFAERKNPNGCPVSLTYFVSHNYTDYSLVEDLYYNGSYEMADHSVDHREPTTWWKNATLEEWTQEIVDQRDILMKWGNIPNNTIKGFRAPFLVTSENELEALYLSNFTYEASMGTRDMYWPFTLDYKSPICADPATCPDKSYPGLWLVPNILYEQKDGSICAMLDACTYPKSEQDWLDFFMDNFNGHYKNRAPFGIYAHSAWFYFGSERAAALNAFLDKVLAMDNVYIVTHSQLLDWVRNPTPLDKIKDFAPWQCPKRPSPRCSYEQPGCQKSYSVGTAQRNFRTCTTPCPPNYPQYGNPYGN